MPDRDWLAQISTPARWAAETIRVPFECRWNRAGRKTPWAFLRLANQFRDLQIAHNLSERCPIRESLTVIHSEINRGPKMLHGFCGEIDPPLVIPWDYLRLSNAWSVIPPEGVIEFLHSIREIDYAYFHFFSLSSCSAWRARTRSTKPSRELFAVTGAAKLVEFLSQVRHAAAQSLKTLPLDRW